MESIASNVKCARLGDRVSLITSGHHSEESSDDNSNTLENNSFILGSHWHPEGLVFEATRT
jgi:hypothetical protein